MKTLPIHKAFVVFAIVGLLACPSGPFAAEVGLRIRFGLMDKEPKTWDGSVTAQPGKVALIGGWRFEQGDHATGTEGWTAATRAAGDFRTNAQKAKAKANAGAAAKAKAKAGAGGNALADNGVLITLADVTEASVVQVKTEQGEFSFTLSEIPYGKYIERLTGGVEIERVAPRD